jgi:hypothetical protein
MGTCTFETPELGDAGWFGDLDPLAGNVALKSDPLFVIDGP